MASEGKYGQRIGGRRYIPIGAGKDYKAPARDRDRENLRDRTKRLVAQITAELARRQKG